MSVDILKFEVETFSVRCGFCMNDAADKVTLRLGLGSRAAVHLCTVHTHEVLAAVGTETRQQLNLMSLGDAVRTGKPFRRAGWQYLRVEVRTFKDEEKRLVCWERLGPEYWWDFKPTPEDCWALDYENI